MKFILLAVTAALAAGAAAGPAVQRKVRQPSLPLPAMPGATAGGRPLSQAELAALSQYGVEGSNMRMVTYRVDVPGELIRG